MLTPMRVFPSGWQVRPSARCGPRARAALALTLALSSAGGGWAADGGAPVPDAPRPGGAPTQAELARLTGSLQQLEPRLLAAARMVEEAQRVGEAEAALDKARVRASEALDAPPGSERAGEVFLALVEAQDGRLQSVFDALRQGRAPTPLEREAAEALVRAERALHQAQLTPGPALEGDTELRTRVEATEDALERYRVARQDSWGRVAQLRFASVRALNEARVALRERLPPAVAGRLRSLSRVAVDNLELDGAQVGAAAWLHFEHRRHDLRHLDEVLADPFRVTAILVAGGKLLVLLLVFVWLWRLVHSNRERLKSWALSKASTARTARVIEPLVALVELGLPPLSILALAGLVQVVLGDVAPQPELLIAAEVVAWAAAYRFFADLTQWAILRLARRHHRLHVKTRLKIWRTVRVGMRYVFGVTLGLVVASQIVGTVVVAPVLRLIFALGAVALFVWHTWRWREEIAAEYLEDSPEGRLAPGLQRGGRGPVAFALILAGLFVVVGRGIAAVLTDFVLGWGQTRRALSFFFRYRLAKQGEGAEPAGAAEPLPARVTRAFSPEPTTKRAYLVDRFEGVGELVEMLHRFPTRGNAVVVHGELGMGRSTWLENARPALGPHARVWTLRPTHRITRPELLLAWLADHLGEHGPSTVEGLAERLNAAPRVVLLDGLEQCFLRSTEGMNAVDALLSLVNKTRESTLWCLTCTSQAWAYLRHTRDVGPYFDHAVSLRPWTEEQMRLLILKRLSECGVKVSFEELLVREMEGVSDTVQIVANQEGFIRLLTDFAEGNPRVALHYWVRSLIPDGTGGVIVRLYDAPTADALERLPDDSRFLLQSVVLHGRMTAQEAARSLLLPLERVEALVAHMAREGIFQRPALEPAGAVGVSVHWWEAVKRFLRRKNLLE